MPYSVESFASEPPSFKSLQIAFAAHLRDPELNPAPPGIEDRRMQIYRDLFFNNIENLLATGFPVIKQLLGKEQWLFLVRRFYAEHEAHTPLFPEIGREFQRYLQIRAARGETDPPFLVELAHYEWIELALALDENEIDAIPHDPDGDIETKAPVVSPLAMLLQYQFPVSKIRPGFQPEAPPEQPTYLIVTRNRHDEIQFTEVNALSFKLLEVLKANPGVSGLEAVQALVAALQAPEPAPLIQAALSMLRKFRERDILLGTMRE